VSRDSIKILVATTENDASLAENEGQCGQ